LRRNRLTQKEPCQYALSLHNKALTAMQRQTQLAAVSLGLNTAPVSYGHKLCQSFSTC